MTLTYGSSCSSIEIYQPPVSWNADNGAHLNRLQFQQQQNSIHAAKQLDIQSSQVYETGCLCEPEVLNLEETYSLFLRNKSEKMSIEEENLQKRKLPVASSVVEVKKIQSQWRKGGGRRWLWVPDRKPLQQCVGAGEAWTETFTSTF